MVASAWAFHKTAAGFDALAARQCRHAAHLIASRDAAVNPLEIKQQGKIEVFAIKAGKRYRLGVLRIRSNSPPLGLTETEFQKFSARLMRPVA
jgi:hypothetical protein